MISDSTSFAFRFFVFVSFVGFHQTLSCQAFHKKLNQYSLPLTYQPDRIFTPLRLCPSPNNTCCPQSSADLIENATVIELYQLFELYSMNIYEPLLRIRQNFNKTFVLLVESSRNETHQVLQRGYHQLYISYRSIVDRFFSQLRQLTSRSLRENLSLHVEQLFQDILRTSLTFNQNQSFLQPEYFSCLWKNQPFGATPTLFVNQLENSLNKLFQLSDAFKFSHELVQVISASVTTDYHCIESYLQLAFCNLCRGRDELPCRTTCRRVMEHCLVNGTLIDAIWQEFIDSTENFEYFHGVEKTFSSIGLSISEAVMTFLNSGGVQNKEIINQCGRLRVRRQTFALETHVNDDDDDDDQTRRSLFDRHLAEWSQALQRHRLFWKQLPEQICRINGVSTDQQRTCWSETSLGEDQVGRTIDEKPLNLKLQWILKELREKSRSIGSMRRTTAAPAPAGISSTTTRSPSPMKTSADLDDYPSENEIDYSDYAYEDATEQISTTTTTTTTTSTTSSTTTPSTTTIIDDASIDESQASFYDYGDHDLYSDDEMDETTPFISTTQSTTTFSPTTQASWKDRIPYYHRRTPIVWNVQYEENTQRSGNSAPRIYSPSLLLLLLLLLLILIPRV